MVMQVNICSYPFVLVLVIVIDPRAFDYEHEHDSLIPLLFVIFVSLVLFVVLP